MRYITLYTLTLILASCAPDAPEEAPVRKTAPGGEVDLSGVTLVIENPKLSKNKKGIHMLTFDYTLDNTSGYQIEFPHLYPNTDPLIQINLTDKKDKPITLGTRPLDALTMAQPKPKRIKLGRTTRAYTIPVLATSLAPGDPVHVRVRFHAPSRYDELRTSIEALPLTLSWPGKPPEKKP